MKLARRFAAIVWMSIFLPPGAMSADQLFDIKEVVPGVYAAIAKPQYKVNCNAAIIMLDNGVLVVDTHSKPSAARALIAQIKTLTEKPVRYVVNSHFHWDHYQGNQAYPSSWPAGIEIISSEATRESILHRGIPRVKHEILSMPKEIDALRGQLSKATDPQERATLQENLRQAEEYFGELKSMQVNLPSLTFDHSLILHRSSRTVEILWFGKAHTDGDVFVYLPKEKFIATGDALQGWMPYMGDGYPYDWIKTLEKVEQLDFEYVVGGHGDVLRGKAQFELWRHYLIDLMEATEEAFAQGETMAEAEKSVAEKLASNYAGKFPPGMYPESVGANIQKAYRVVSGQTD